MPTPLEIQNGALRCQLLPEVGGCVAGLWLDRHPVLRSKPASELHTAHSAGSYPLVPFSNRIGQGQFNWNGRTYTLPANFAPEPHAIHGVGWARAWDVESASDSRAVLVYHHAADAAWPFAFESRQVFTLTQDALEMQMHITNRADQPAPVGLGWHPYFVKSAHSHIRFAARQRWDMGSDMLPTQSHPHTGLDTNCTTLDVDHCFSGWDGALEFSEGPLRLRIHSDLNHLVVFTTPARDSIAIEPVSHVNNALALAQQTGQSPQTLGLRVLQPGESFGANMRIHVELAA